MFFPFFKIIWDHTTVAGPVKSFFACGLAPLRAHKINKNKPWPGALIRVIKLRTARLQECLNYPFVCYIDTY